MSAVTSTLKFNLMLLRLIEYEWDVIASYGELEE